MTSWTYPQQVALALTPKVSSTLSLLGSSLIVAETTLSTQKNARKKENVYSRLLLAMACYDIAESVWNFASTWPMIPTDNAASGDGSAGGVAFAAGNAGTCVAQGFFLQLGVAVPIYNASLSVYYLMVIKYGTREDVLRRRFEPLIHFVAFAFSFGTATAAVVLNLFNNANLWCWIAPYPSDCIYSFSGGEGANCERGDNAWIYRWAFYYAPLWTCILVAIVTMTFVYCAVRRNDNASLKYREPQVRFGETTTVIRGERNTISSEDKDTRRSCKAVEDEIVSSASQQQQQQQQLRVSTEGKADHELSQSSFSSAGSRRSSIAKHYHSWVESRRDYAKHHRRSMDVFYQAVWYLAAFLLTHLFSTANRSIQLATGGSTYFPLILLHSFFDPLQGFFNFIIFRRPRYVRYRRDRPERSRLDATIYALRWSPSTSSVRRRGALNSTISQQSTGSYWNSNIPSMMRGDSSSSIAMRRTSQNRSVGWGADGSACLPIRDDVGGIKDGKIGEIERGDLDGVGSSKEMGEVYHCSPEATSSALPSSIDNAETYVLDSAEEEEKREITLDGQLGDTAVTDKYGRKFNSS